MAFSKTSLLCKNHRFFILFLTMQSCVFFSGSGQGRFHELTGTHSCDTEPLASQHQLFPDKITSLFLALWVVLHTNILWWIPSYSCIHVICTTSPDWTLMHSYKASSSSTTMPKAKPKVSFMYFGYTQQSEASSRIHFSSRHCKHSDDALNPS